MTAAPAGRVAGEGALLVLLAAVTAIGGVTLNVYLPARPAAQAEFHASLAATGLTVSLPGIAFAIGLLAYGPWSDRVGRRRVLLTGLGLFTIGTAIALVSGSMTMLIVGRFIQALGGAAGVTVGRAVVNDLFPREHVSRNLAYLTMVVALANALAISGLPSPRSGAAPSRPRGGLRCKQRRACAALSTRTHSISGEPQCLACR